MAVCEVERLATATESYPNGIECDMGGCEWACLAFEYKVIHEINRRRGSEVVRMTATRIIRETNKKPCLGRSLKYRIARDAKK